MNLVDDDHAGKVAQGRHGLGEAGQAHRIFEIEIVERFSRYELPGKSGFAALTGAQKRDHPAALQSSPDQPDIDFAIDHAPHYLH